VAGFGDRRGGIRRLIGIIDRYGEALEADLIATDSD
jgi:hypothetical protein